MQSPTDKPRCWTCNHTLTEVLALQVLKCAGAFVNQASNATLRGEKSIFSLISAVHIHIPAGFPMIKRANYLKWR